MPHRSTERRLPLRSLALAVMIPVGALLGGCGSDAQAGSLLGAAIGALAGQAIGGDTEATLIGTGIGAGVGYAIGNESDKAHSYHSRRGYHGRRYYGGGRCNYDY